jgi:hypothetical protein
MDQIIGRQRPLWVVLLEDLIYFPIKYSAPRGEIFPSRRLIDLHFIPIAVQKVAEYMTPFGNPIGLTAHMPEFFLNSRPIRFGMRFDKPVQRFFLRSFKRRSNALKIRQEHPLKVPLASF